MLVNNAGGAFGIDPVAMADPDDWRAMYDVNVLGALRVTQALLPALVASGRGHVVVMGSTAGRIVYEGGGGYTAAKHGAAALAETLRLELNGQPVRVTEIAPGMVADRRSSRRQALPRRRGAGRRGLRRGRRAADGRRHRRLRRLVRDPPAARRHRPARRQAARAGGAAQGGPAYLTTYPLAGLTPDGGT